MTNGEFSRTLDYTKASKQFRLLFSIFLCFFFQTKKSFIHWILNCKNLQVKNFEEIVERVQARHTRKKNHKVLLIKQPKSTKQNIWFCKKRVVIKSREFSRSLLCSLKIIHVHKSSFRFKSEWKIEGFVCSHCCFVFGECAARERQSLGNKISVVIFPRFVDSIFCC